MSEIRTFPREFTVNLHFPCRTLLTCLSMHHLVRTVIFSARMYACTRGRRRVCDLVHCLHKELESKNNKVYSEETIMRSCCPFQCIRHRTEANVLGRLEEVGTLDSGGFQKTLEASRRLQKLPEASRIKEAF